MNITRGNRIASQRRVDHISKLARQGITDHGDQTISPTSNQRKSTGIVAGDHQEIFRFPFDDFTALGDVAGVPKGKTTASVKWQVPVVEDHLVAAISGKEGTASYNGYTSCPLITRVGRAMLIEFDYDNNLTPSFPGVIAPLEELWISWLVKELALKPTYNAMLRGEA